MVIPPFMQVPVRSTFVLLLVLLDPDALPISVGLKKMWRLIPAVGSLVLAVY
jgi:hypothetical protein